MIRNTIHIKKKNHWKVDTHHVMQVMILWIIHLTTNFHLLRKNYHYISLNLPMGKAYHLLPLRINFGNMIMLSYQPNWQMTTVSLHNCVSIYYWLEMMHVVVLLLTMHRNMSIKMLRSNQQMSRIVSQKLWFQEI